MKTCDKLVTGCDPQLITPEIRFQATSKPAGYLETSWSQPQLIIAKNEVVTLNSRHYLVNVSHIEEKLILDQHNIRLLELCRLFLSTNSHLCPVHLIFEVF